MFSSKDPDSDEDCGDGPTKEMVRLCKPSPKFLCAQVREQLLSASVVNPSILVCAPSNVTTYIPALGLLVEPRNTDPFCKAGENHRVRRGFDKVEGKDVLLNR